MHDRQTAPAARIGWRFIVVFLAFTAIALFFLLSEHRIHALGWLPLLLFAACPLMHLLMHGGHGHGGHGHGGTGSSGPGRAVEFGATQANGEN